jgi:hypothetical protein
VGTQDMRYAYFPELRRLVIERAGECTIFDTAEHQFRGVLQMSGPDAALSFLSQHGRVDLDSLSALWLRILWGQLQETAAR